MRRVLIVVGADSDFFSLNGHIGKMLINGKY